MGKVQNLINEQKTELKQLLYNYTMTLIIGSLISVVYVVNDMFDLDSDNFMQHFYTIMFAFAIGCFFVETFYINRNEPKKIGLLSMMYVVSFAVAVLVDLLVDNLENLTDKQAYYISIYITALYVSLVCIAFYKLVKKNAIEVEKYFARVLFGLLKVWGLFFLLYAAVILILEIFNSLIADIDYWDFISRIEILLIGFLYFPYSVLTVSDTREDNSRFTKGLLMYALMPCVLIATGIIYLYIFKIIASGELPSNQVFRICAELFLLGGPIWLMSGVFLKEKAEKKGVPIGIYGKIVGNMAYVYIPCIILEIICIGIRIGEYGFTESRYMAVAVIIFQIIYVAWKPLMKLIKKEEGYEGLILVFLGMFLIATIAPFVNIQKVSFLSQKARFEKAMEEGNMVVADGVYDYLRYTIYGEEYLDENYTKEELSELKENVYQENPNAEFEDFESAYFYVPSSRKDEGLNIKGYTNMYPFSYFSDYEETYTLEDLSEMVIEYGSNDSFQCYFDATAMVEKYMELDENRENYTSAMDYDYYILGQNACVVIMEIGFDYNPYSGEIKDLDYSGYILINEEGHNGQ